MCSDYRSSKVLNPISVHKEIRAYARFNGDIARTPQTWMVHFVVNGFPTPSSPPTKLHWLSIEKLEDWKARISIRITVPSKDDDPLPKAEERLFNFLSTYNVLFGMQARIENCEGANELVVGEDKEMDARQNDNSRRALGAISNVMVTRCFPKVPEDVRLRNFQETARMFELKETLVSEPSFVRLAIGYYNLGKSSTEWEEIILDWVVALEALFSDSEGELQHKLSIRVAWMIGDDGKDRTEIAKRVGSLYRIRSAIVHGKPFKIVEDDIRTLEIYVRRSIIKILDRADRPSKDMILEELHEKLLCAT